MYHYLQALFPPSSNPYTLRAATMGNAASKYTAVSKLAAELPAAKTMEYNSDWIKHDVSMKVFADDKDREQFICVSPDLSSPLPSSLFLRPTPHAEFPTRGT